MRPELLPDGPQADPYPEYTRLRERGGVHLIQEPTGLCRWTAVSYRHAWELLADDRISKDPRLAWNQLLRAGYLTGDDETDSYIFHIANSDPPDHTRLRRLVQQAFTTGRVDRLRPRAQQVADELLDRVPEDGLVDLVEDYALPLATTVTAELLGVPSRDLADYHLWTTAMLIPPGTPSPPMSRADAYRRTMAFFADLIAQRRAEPAGSANDLLGALIVARDGKDRLTEAEMVALVMFMLSTGQEPTVHTITSGVLALLDNPDQLTLLRRRPDLLDAAVEEILRFDPPVSVSSLRIAREDIDTGNAVVPSGGIVSILFGAANRDPERFEDPERFDIERPSGSHLGFGAGIHRCLGAPLGRMVARVAIGTLLSRYAGIELACRVGELRWRPTRVTRGVVSLPLHLSVA